MSRLFPRLVIFSLLALACPWVTAQQMAPVSPLYHPAPALTGHDLAVIVNDADPLSQQIAKYYQQQRQIPADQVIHVRFPPNQPVLSRQQFEPLKQQVDRLTPTHVQAYVLTWLKPFRVDCMSITTAFAAGFSESFCAQGCQQTHNSPYFGSETDKPFKALGWRPTMALAGENFAEVKTLIDTGVAADYSHPQGTAYLLKTSDKARSSRAAFFPEVAAKMGSFWPIQYLEKDYIIGREDVMFYFTGLTRVPHIAANRYLPGAIADHLTSTGGVMSGSDQMNILEWLRAGATASYGAVVEPCNFPAKFPNPGVLMYFYLRGSSLIEAYWKSVAQPGQGIFVGEPLAKPFAYRPGSAGASK